MTTENYPRGVVTRACNVGPEIAMASGEKLTMEVVVVPSCDLWWGDALLTTTPLRLRSAPGEGLAFSLPVTDQDGWRVHPAADVMKPSVDGIPTRTYTVTVTTLDALGRIVNGRRLWFVLPAGDLTPVTIDAWPPTGPEAAEFENAPTTTERTDS